MSDDETKQAVAPSAVSLSASAEGDATLYPIPATREVDDPSSWLGFAPSDGGPSPERRGFAVTICRSLCVCFTFLGFIGGLVVHFAGLDAGKPIR
jgi:hypothetical protein